MKRLERALPLQPLAYDEMLLKVGRHSYRRYPPEYVTRLAAAYEEAPTAYGPVVVQKDQDNEQILFHDGLEPSQVALLP